MGVGIVSFRKIKVISMVSLRGIKKYHLINKMLPIFDKYPLFSNKQYDYLRLRKVNLTYRVFYDVIPDSIHHSLPFNYIEYIVNAPYFSAWLVGFIEAEGCFSVYKLDKADDYFVASFDLSKTNGDILILAISKYLSLTPQPYKYKTNNLKFKVKVLDL